MFFEDHRVRAARTPSWYKSFDQRRMEATVSYSDDEGEEQEIVLPCKYEVCPTCNGKGTHVNPSIDAHGLSAEDFAEDPDFKEDYFNGVYDVICHGCGGKNVTPVADFDRFTKAQTKIWCRIEKAAEEDAEFEAICASERRMGA